MNNYTRGSGLLESFLTKQRAKRANTLIQKKSRRERILDIGCGSFPYFLTVVDFKEKYGIDPFVSTSLIKTKSIKLIKNKVDSKKLSFQDNYFDTVTMLAVFEHIDGDKLMPILKEIHRVLKKDGLFIITTPAPWADKLLHQMSKLGLISSEEIHEHKHNHPRRKIENFLEKSGFKKKNIKSGFFELYMNMWFTGVK
jgi:ubiquinone/menaquinone biosynthesis C-methylase UbiE